MKYRNRANPSSVVEAERVGSAWLVTGDFDGSGERKILGLADCELWWMYEPMPEYVGPAPDGMACNDSVRIDKPVTQTLRLTGFVGGFPFGYTVPLTGGRLPDYLPKPTIAAITNTYHDDGKVTESWTAKNEKDGIVLTNNMSGAIHELPKTAVEALLVLRSCH